MRRISSKEELIELIGRVIEKFENDTGELLIKNTNRENYVKLAKVLSEISKQLPYTSAELQHEPYEEDAQSHLDYPNRKYDITGGQLKDAYFGIVNKPRPYLLEACYIYLTGKGRAAYLENSPTLFGQSKGMLKRNFSKSQRILIYLIPTIFLFTIFLVLFLFNYYRSNLPNQLAYVPTQAEINALSGIWMYYTGAPQARSNEPNRFRQYVNNLMEVKYRNGQFEFIRHGANINHYGYMLINSPGIISIHSYVRKLKNGEVLSPSHSLARLDTAKRKMIALSATWSFESENRDEIIAIRNIYQKIADHGSLKEIKNTQQNAACNCKIMEWNTGDKSKRFELRYQHLDNIENAILKENLNEESILLLKPNEGVILKE